MSINGWWGRPRAGHVELWVATVVAISCVAAVILVGVGAYELARAGAPTLRGEYFTRVIFDGPSWKHVLPALAMAVVLGVCALPESTTTRWIRLAVALPITHAVAMVLALLVVPSLDLRTLTDHAPYFDALPVLPWLASGLGLVLLLGFVIGGRREWAHAFVMLALAFLLLFGLWLPIASMFPVRVDDWGWSTYKATRAHLEANPESIAAFVIVPPFVVATLYTVFAVRAPHLAKRIRLPIFIALILLCLTSLGTRANANVGAFMVHDNFMHLLFAALMIAIIATVTLSLTTWYGSWRDLKRLSRQKTAREFAITDDGPEEVATMEITDFLRGPRIWMRSFIASDGNEELRVPAGGKLVTAIPKLSSVMRLGEQIVVVTKRDRVRLGGLTSAEVGESPFRSHTITEVGPGLLVARAQPISTPVESMLLTAWRPSLAYLVILVVVAIPSLLGVFIDGKHH